MPFKISKLFYNTNWQNLNLINDASINWTSGIAIIKDRFESRFFNQIDHIKNDEFSGFAVMALDCLLIETLMQFYLGVDDTKINYNGNQWKAFRDFFKNSRHFDADFKPGISKIFHDHFRCGLLHQAQTKQNSLIKISQPALLTLVDPNRKERGFIIDRAKFHDKLRQEFMDYLDRLEKNTANFKGQNLRSAALLKMDLICAE